LTEVFLNLTEVFLNLAEVFLTLTEVLPCFFLSCKANARVKLTKMGHGPHSSTLVCICVVRLLFLLFYVLFVCKCVLPPDDNPIAVNKYIISYHIILYHIIKDEADAFVENRFRKRWTISLGATRRPLSTCRRYVINPVFCLKLFSQLLSNKVNSIC
jgi:hypothetical protein